MGGAGEWGCRGTRQERLPCHHWALLTAENPEAEFRLLLSFSLSLFFFVFNVGHKIVMNHTKWYSPLWSVVLIILPNCLSWLRLFKKKKTFPTNLAFGILLSSKQSMQEPPTKLSWLKSGGRSDVKWEREIEFLLWAA